MRSMSASRPNVAAEIHDEMHGGDARFDVVGIHVHDRHVEALG